MFKMLVHHRLIVLAIIPQYCLRLQAKKDTLNKYCSDIEGLWFSSGNSCWKYFPQQFTWEEADKKCVNEPPAGIKGRLAVIPDSEVYKWLRGQYNFAKTGPSWFGLRAKVENADFNKRYQWGFMVGKKVVADWKYAVTGQRCLPLSSDQNRCKDTCMKLHDDSMRSHIAEPCLKNLHAICEFLVDPNKNYCVPNSCLNGGTCTDRVNGYTCRCKPGFTGTRCQTNKNECASNPCVNGGKCTDKVNGYTCTCNPGYIGNRCQINKNECASNPCVNGGKCTDKVNGYTCTCNPGYIGNRCQINKNECASNPCVNGGKCTDKVNGYTCTCNPGYIGNRCQINKNECASNPCVNGGKCTDKVNGYTCTCKPGYIGNRCQINKNECASNPCVNGGKCTDKVNGYTCTCNPGYIGNRCQINKNECASNPCVNGGKCTDKVNGYTCTCKPGYIGNRCQINKNECASNPCVNGGKCTDKINEYTCTCKPGYIGKRCQTDKNECASDPCANGGKCTDKINGYTCTCKSGFIGKRCQTNKNECASNPCANGGKCTDKINEYTCTCKPGYIGKRCQTDKNECASNPCANGGKCTDKVNGYTCTCKPGYIGNRCQTNVDECSSNPCQNGGTCNDRVNGYTCKCLGGFAGPECEKNIDECGSEPCQNGGTCYDLINKFNCSCGPGYIGKMCETDFNECHSNPCVNGGTCIDKVNNFTCNCTYLYVGYTCDIDCHWTKWGKAKTCHKEGKNCVRQLTRTSKSNVSHCKPCKKDTETTEKCDHMDCHRMTSTERIIAAVLQSIGCIWLLGLIALTFVTCLIFKARNLERLLHACEEIVLFIGHLFILFLREATWSHTICTITSVGLQFTMISLFVFFVLEALQQYAYMTNVQVTGNFMSCRTNLVVGFGLPLITTTISAAFWAKNYPAEWSCWLNLGHTLSAGSIVPLLFCSLLTIVILEAATQGEYEELLGVDKTKRLLAKVNHKALLFILPITIAHWITGMYSIYEQYITMYTLVFGLNITLGVLIFIFHGLTHGAVNKYFLKLWRNGRNIVIGDGEKVVEETTKANADSGNAPVVNEVEDLYKWAMNGTLADKKRAKEILFGIKADPLPPHKAKSTTPPQQLQIVLQPDPKLAPIISEADMAEGGSLYKWAMNGTMADKNQAKQLLFGATISPHSINH